MFKTDIILCKLNVENYWWGEGGGGGGGGVVECPCGKNWM